MAFRKLNHLKNYIMGSIVSDTGSEYIFGYDGELKWLGRSGIEYTAADKEWRDAERFIHSSLAGTPSQVEPEMGDAPRPARVTRSNVAGIEMGAPGVLELDEEEDYEDGEIAGQAAQWLEGLGQ